MFSFALEYAIRRVLVNQEVMELNGTNPRIVHGDDVHILSGSIRSIQKNKL